MIERSDTPRKARLLAHAIISLEVVEGRAASFLALLCCALPVPTEDEPDRSAEADDRGHNDACDDGGVAGGVAGRGVVARGETGEKLGSHNAFVKWA